MTQTILLHGAKQVLTLRGNPGVRRGPEFGNLGVIEAASVLIENARVSSVGPTRRLENLNSTRNALHIPVHNCVVMPAFIDAAMNLTLINTAGKGRRKLLDFHNDSIALMRSCLQYGTLNALVKASSGTGSISADVSVLRQLRRITNSPVGLTCHWQVDAEGTGEADSKTLAAALETVHKQRLAAALAMGHGPNGAYDERLLEAAHRAAIPVSLNWKGGDNGNLRRALEGTKASTVFCDHKPTRQDCETLATSDTTAVFRAGDSLLDQQPDGSIQELVAAGGVVALGSGYDARVGLNFNMQLVLALAVRRLQLTIEQAIVATTINAAHALHCGKELGSLEPGKRADIIVLNLNDYREIPRHLGMNNVVMVIRDGELVINRTGWKGGAR